MSPQSPLRSCRHRSSWLRSLEEKAEERGVAEESPLRGCPRLLSSRSHEEEERVAGRGGESSGKRVERKIEKEGKTFLNPTNGLDALFLGAVDKVRTRVPYPSTTLHTHIWTAPPSLTLAQPDY